MSEPPPPNIKIKEETVRTAYDRWWNGMYNRDPITRVNLVTEAFVAGWNSGRASYIENFTKLIDILAEEKSKDV